MMGSSQSGPEKSVNVLLHKENNNPHDASLLTSFVFKAWIQTWADPVHSIAVPDFPELMQN